MKRKIKNLDEEESRLSSLLFNKAQKFTDHLSAQVKIDDIDKKPAWVDEDDELYSSNVIPNIKNDGHYVQKLKQKYEVLVGTPSWAKIKEKKDDGDENSEILRTVGHLKKSKFDGLKKNVLEIKNFPKINKETDNEGPLINNIEFHPKMSVVLVAGYSGVVSLYSLGNEYTKLHSFQLKKFMVTDVHFTPDGSEAYIASTRQHSYCIYNLVTAEPKLVQLPRIVRSPKIFQMSPDGKLLATSEGFDEVYIISTESRELVRSLKHNTNVASVIFGHDSNQLISYGVQGVVTIWDLSTFRAMNKFYDHGCVTASCITTSPCGNLLATGSGEGIVNIYETAKLNTNSPIPFKTITNLNTKITKLRFNATTEILSLSSSYYPNAMKLVHIPSYHVFCNFPQKNLYQIQTVSFSPNSGYMAVGNNRGCAYLYRLKYFKNY